MNMQKGFSKVVLILVVMVVIVGVGYFVYKNSDGRKISYSDQWKQAQFPQNDYYHSVNLMLPATWEFNCCGDTDSRSTHVIFPPSSSIDNFAGNPYIAVHDFSKVTCPNGELYSCSIDEVQPVTPSQFMVSLMNHADGGGELTGLKSLRKTGTIKLSNFSTNVVVYSGVSRSNQPVDLYLIQSSKGVVGVAFQQPQSFDSKFKTEFLNRITSN